MYTEETNKSSVLLFARVVWGCVIVVAVSVAAVCEIPRVVIDPHECYVATLVRSAVVMCLV